MKRRWIRVPPERGDNVRSALVAGVLAAGVGVVTFWVVRLFQAREPLGGAPPTVREEPSREPGEGA